MASTPSPLGVPSIANGYPKRNHSRPSGRACCFVLGYRLGTRVPPWGPPPHPGPAVHSFGRTALHWAAFYGNRRIVRSLVASGADVNAQDRVGCAVSACGESAECAGPIPRRRAGTRRCTMPRTMANPTMSPSCCCAAPTGPSGTTTCTAALRRTAEPKTATAARAQAHAEAVGGTESEARAVRGGREPGALRPPPHSPRLPAPQRCWCRRMCRRRSPSALADPAGTEATQHWHCNGRPRRAWSCTIAPAGRSVEHIAREPLLSSAAQSAHAHAVLCRAQRGGTGTKGANARA
jgi:hypothetical protein